MKTTQIIKITLMLPLVAVLMFSCRKDDPIDPPIDDPSDTVQEPPASQELTINDISLEDTSCHDLGGGGSGNQTFYESAFQYKTPCFNPNNSNEFIYYYKNNQTAENHLIKYDLQTEQKTTIDNNYSSITPPQWGTNDQIVYNPNYNISIMSSSGSGLTQISNATHHLYPAWDYACENLYWQYSEMLSAPYYLLKKSLIDNSVDTILDNTISFSGFARYIDVSSDNKILFKTYLDSKTYIAYLLDSELNDLFQLELNNMVSTTGLSWAPNGEDFYFTVVNGDGRGLYKMNINNPNEATKLIKYCTSKHYVKIDCDPTGQYLIGERKVNYVQNNKTYSDSKIYKINLNTLEETKIDLE